MAEPSHVRLAVLLGWRGVVNLGPRTYGGGTGHVPGDDLWVGLPPLDEVVGGELSCRPIPVYDRDWAATGPLIERYALHLSPVFRPVGGDVPLWGARPCDRVWHDWEGWRHGSTALEAVTQRLIDLLTNGA